MDAVAMDASSDESELTNACFYARRRQNQLSFETSFFRMTCVCFGCLCVLIFEWFDYFTIYIH